jgi:hypothetical protein
MRPSPFIFLFGVSAFVVVAACGSRGPLDINGVDYKPDSGVTDTGVIIADTGADVQPETSDGRDSGPLVNCGMCVTQKCGMQFLQCFQSTPCRTTLQCAIQNCGGMNGFNAQCLLQKCGADLTGLAQLIAVVTCVASNCGQDCLGFLGGMMDVVPPPDDNH